MLAKARLVGFLALIMAIWACSGSDEQKAHAKAEAGLAEFRKLVDKDNYRRLGFESVAELDKMELGVAMPVFFVGLSDVKEFTEGDDVERLLKHSSIRLYPVLVDGQPRSSVTLSERDGSWEVGNFGRPSMARAVTAVRNQQAAAAGQPYEAFFAVEIPSLYLVFVGYRDGGQVWLTHVYDQAEFGFQAGAKATAGEIMASLSAGVQDTSAEFPFQ